MIILIDGTSFNVSGVIASLIGKEIVSEEMTKWFREEHLFKDPQMFICLDEENNMTGIMCRERDDDNFLSQIAYREAVFW